MKSNNLNRGGAKAGRRLGPGALLCHLLCDSGTFLFVAYFVPQREF